MSDLVAVSFDVARPVVTAAFWAGMLGRETVEEPGGVLVPGGPTQVGLRFVGSRTERTERPERSRLHLHVTADSEADQRRIASRVVELGGRRRGTGPLPIGRDLYFADPDGAEFCLIEPGNRYLDGCGPLGEVTCDGSREAGLFWRDALEWPVVWDEGPQVAVQSPAGGTKLSWDLGAEPEAPWWHRQRFDLVSDDPEREAARLVSLGATTLGRLGAVAMLADPDGSRFTLAPAAPPTQRRRPAGAA